MADDKLASIGAARTEFLKAIGLEDKTKPNPEFKDALARTGKVLRPYERTKILSRLRRAGVDRQPVYRREHR